ncbi:hypothetical protein SCG7109_BC_00060 [Chlamydiales bacterium SCGC AG-110-M15]|nr:hypothetical protein SCG7109_BC_00060 [Chlamydiales bacterium SCGC AG-110-M15]
MEEQKGCNEVEWEVIPSEKGTNALKIGKRAIHSLVDPIKQAELTADTLIQRVKKGGCTYIVIVGFGLGYLPVALLEKGFTDFVVWEPFPNMHHALYPFQSQKCAQEIVERIAFNLHDVVTKLKQYFQKGAKHLLEVHPGYQSFTRLEVKLLLNYFHHLHRTKDQFCFSNSVVCQRSLEVLSRIPFYPTIDDLSGNYGDQKAILVSPGPSLKTCIPFLKNRKEGVIIAALQALPLLQKNGIFADFVAIADPNDLSPFLAACSDDYGYALTECAVHPVCLDWNKERTFLFNLRGRSSYQLLWDKMGVSSMEQPMTTVSEVMLVLATQMGFKQFVFLGMDFSWKEDRYSYRAPGVEANSQDNMEQYFRIRLTPSETAFSESAYFASARYLAVMSKNLSEKGYALYQYTEGYRNLYARQICPEDILKLLAEEREAPQVCIEKKVSQGMVSYARELIQACGDSKHQIPGLAPSPEWWHDANRMPFFDELALENRSVCSKSFLQELEERSRASSD